ncbi:type VI secretion system contractile sheath small subunit, partial [Burkholderia pseudomallei]
MQSANLQTYVDGKSGAGRIGNELRQDAARLRWLAAAPKPQLAGGPDTGNARGAKNAPDTANHDSDAA